MTLILIAICVSLLVSMLKWRSKSTTLRLWMLWTVCLFQCLKAEMKSAQRSWKLLGGNIHLNLSSSHKGCSCFQAFSFITSLVSMHLSQCCGLTRTSFDSKH